MDLPPIIFEKPPALIRPSSRSFKASVSNHKAMLPGMMSPFCGVAGAFSIAAVAQATVDAPSIAIPAAAAAGDLCLLFDLPARLISGTAIPAVTPSGWTSLAQIAGPSGSDGHDIAVFAFAKLLVAGNLGTSVTGTNTATTAGYRRKTMLVFRGVGRPIAGFGAAQNLQQQAVTTTPTNYTLSSGSGRPVVLALAAYRGIVAVTARGFAPAADLEVANGTTAFVKYKVFDGAPANETISCSNADHTIVQTFYLEIT